MTKILLVEDNEMNRDMLSRRLQRRGYEVVIASDGQMGVSMGYAEQPDLILMDMSLPVIDGWEATRQLKADRQTASIPIIALTAHAMVGDREKAMASGCDDYDTKPVELSRLLQKIEALLADRSSELSTGSQISAPTPPSQSLASQSLEAAWGTILIVDDNDMNRDMLSRRLQRAGYTVLVAESGKEGFGIIQQQAVNLVLLDIMMPGIDGLDTLKLIRGLYSPAQLPVIMASAKDQSEDIVQAFELGANDYVTKPIDFPVALARIRAQLSTIQTAHREQIKAIQSPPQGKPLGSSDDSRAPAQPAAPALLERYEIIEQLTQDRSRHLYLARDTQQPDNPLRVIEQLQLNVAAPDWILTSRRFQVEVNTFKQLSEQNPAARLVDAFQQERHFYLVQEFIAGSLLSEELEPGKPQILRTVLSLTIDILKIIQSLHQQHIFHRSLQPSSFLRRQQDRQLLLVDFDIAARLKIALPRNHLDIASSRTNMYAAPEQCDPHPEAGSDIFSIGMITLQALTGKLPSQLPINPATGELHWRHLVTVGESFARILDKMIGHNLEYRYSSVQTVLHELYQLPMVFTLLGPDIACPILN